tara:strand:+ start:187 stop:1770 length:1584 start_codon:yes stop_codon:yes gene_type:complete
MKFRLFTFLIVIIYSCEQPPIIDPINDLSLIPYPNQIISSNQALKISSINSIIGNEKIDDLLKIINKEWGVLVRNINLKKGDSPKSDSIFLQIDNDLNVSSAEGYALKIISNGIIIKGKTHEGIYRGWQTLIQIIELTQNADNPGYIPTGQIADEPKYGYRGTMLDVARHFFDIVEVKRHIDLISYYKINHLHLHLSDDQGWRIEIKSWPKLTEKGSLTEVGGGKGGFFTQDDYKEIVNYAASKFITIVPEIDIPGHTNSALASYEKLNCDGKLRELYTGTNVGFSTLCNNEYSYQFIDDIIREISSISPGLYFHIGGDETYATKKEDYVEFITKTSEIVKKYNKKIIGWDDINIANIPPNTILQFWNYSQTPDNQDWDGQTGFKNILNGLKKKSKVLLSPAGLMYLDMKYDSLTKLGLTWAGTIDLKKGYDWSVRELFPEIPSDKIIGIEAPLWTETAANSSDLEFLTLPRLPGYAEIGWTKSDQREWSDYKVRLASHSLVWINKKINYYPSPLIEWVDKKPDNIN